MSESMNKYHKCIQELGSSLPGWVKVGALAMGVDVGVGGCARTEGRWDGKGG